MVTVVYKTNLDRSVVRWSLFVLFNLYCSVSEGALLTARQLAKDMLMIDGLTDWALQTFFVTVGYSASYLLTGGIFEWTNPIPKTRKRIETLKKELFYGLLAMVCNVAYATTWLWLVDPYTKYYGYYVDHEYNVKEFCKNLIVYMFWMDSWFYWTHRLLHLKFFWNHVHHVHHQFVEPTAFSQDAVHPFEAILQGPMGHHMITLLTPMHPVAMALFGFCTSIFAIAAHDARQWDLNDHVKHHHYGQCNFGLYWALWDYICDTRYSKKKYPREFIPSYKRQQMREEESTQAADKSQ